MEGLELKRIRTELNIIINDLNKIKNTNRSKGGDIDDEQSNKRTNQNSNCPNDSK